MPDEFTPFPVPVAKAVLTIPFWLREAPGPLSFDKRRELLEGAAKKLNERAPLAVPGIDWKVLELAWCREPHRVGLNHQLEVKKIWHPKPAVNRKGSILTGFFLDDELRSIDKELSRILSSQDEVELNVQECSISYFDYGICALEFEFGFTPVGSSVDSNWLASSFWGDFKKKIMDAVEDRNLGVLTKARWRDVQNALVGALADASKGLPPPIRMVPFDEIFGTPKDSPAHVCASFGINFILFGDFRGQTHDEALAALDTTVKTIIGRPISQPDGPARSEDLAYVFYGAVHTLVIIRKNPQEETEKAASSGGCRCGPRYAQISLDGVRCPRRGAARIDGFARRFLPWVF